MKSILTWRDKKVVERADMIGWTAHLFAVPLNQFEGEFLHGECSRQYQVQSSIP